MPTDGPEVGPSTTGIPPRPAAADFDAAASCTVTPAQMEGPYYLDLDTARSDITEGRPGRPFVLGLRVLDGVGCTPVEGAAVEVWHCDATGVYSGFEAASIAANGGQGRPPGAALGGDGPTGGGKGDGTTYLRGGQLTDADGIVSFRTIYPGWYEGRTPHIHVKVFLSNAERLTTQLYFDDAVSDGVYAEAPYTEHTAARTTNNTNDGLIASGGGTPMLTVVDLAPQPLMGMLSLIVAR